MQLTVKAHHAPDAVEDCRRNAIARLQVLHRYGIANITSANQDWWVDHQTYALLLLDRDTGEPLGGVRLQRWANGIPLPFECAVERVDARVRAWVASFAKGGVGELCGLWCSPKVRGLGLGSRLTCMGIALAVQVQTNTLFGICDTRNVVENLRLGFSVDPTLASRGTFEYPRPGLFAHVLKIEDAGRLPEASPEVRSTISDYRERPVGWETIAGERGGVALTRDLRIPSLAVEAHRAPARDGASELKRGLGS